MIKKDTFTLDWVKHVNIEQGWNRKIEQFKNIEKAIMALKLLESLKVSGIDFIFKGGTSLMLLFDKIYRLSVDIDLIIECDDKYMEKFDSICSNNIFTHWKPQVRQSEDNKKTKHYCFYYKPFVDDTEESFVLLDVYEGKPLYSKTKDLPIVSSIINTDDKSVYVKVPTIDCILADKLTAFAPNTIGVKLSAEPGKRPKRVEILKQLFDVANLFDRCSDIKTIRDTYIKIANEEIDMAGLNYTYVDTLRDSFDFALIIGMDGKIDVEKYNVLSKGYNEFNKFVVDLSFNKFSAILAASKVAYLAKLISHNYDIIEKYDDKIDLRELVIKDARYKDLSSYLYSSPEAYYYFVKALSIDED